ncbi:MAG: HAMP domain-containing sensor histidine kinase [Myxococcota bacterium]
MDRPVPSLSVAALLALGACMPHHAPVDAQAAAARGAPVAAEFTARADGTLHADRLLVARTTGAATTDDDDVECEDGTTPDGAPCVDEDDDDSSSDDAEAEDGDDDDDDGNGDAEAEDDDDDDDDGNGDAEAADEDGDGDVDDDDARTPPAAPGAAPSSRHADRAADRNIYGGSRPVNPGATPSRRRRALRGRLPTATSPRTPSTPAAPPGDRRPERGRRDPRRRLDRHHPGPDAPRRRHHRDRARRRPRRYGAVDDAPPGPPVDDVDRRWLATVGASGSAVLGSWQLTSESFEDNLEQRLMAEVRGQAATVAAAFDPPGLPQRDLAELRDGLRQARTAGGLQALALLGPDGQVLSADGGPWRLADSDAALIRAARGGQPASGPLYEGSEARRCSPPTSSLHRNPGWVAAVESRGATLRAADEMEDEPAGAACSCCSWPLARRCSPRPRCARCTGWSATSPTSARATPRDAVGLGGPVEVRRVAEAARSCSAPCRSARRAPHCPRPRGEAGRHLAAAVAHEVRNPLNAIGLALQRLYRVDGDAAADLRRQVRELVGEIEGIVVRFMDLARPPEPVLRPVRAAALWRDLAVDAAAVGVELVVPDADLALHTDDSLVRQALRNLLRNAGEAGASTVTVALVERHPPTVEVSDDGPGIPEDQVPVLFDWFHTTRAAGSGLGLASARRALRALGGDLELVSPRCPVPRHPREGRVSGLHPRRRRPPRQRRAPRRQPRRRGLRHRDRLQRGGGAGRPARARRRRARHRPAHGRHGRHRAPARSPGARPRTARPPRDRPRHPRAGDRRHPQRRLRVPDQAAADGRRPAAGPQRRRAAPPVAGGARAAPRRRDRRQLRRARPRAVDRRPRRPERGDRAAARRERHGQGDVRAPHPRGRSRASRAFVAGTAAPSPTPSSSPSCSATPAARSPARPATAPGCSRPPTAAPCSSTRSAS